MDSILSTVQTQVLIACRAEFDTSWYQSGRRDPFNRLYYIEAGTGFVAHNRRKFTLRPGRLYIIPANAWHENGTDRRVTIRWTHFTSQLQGGIDLFAYLPCPYELTLPDRRPVEKLFSRLIALWSGQVPGREFEIIGLQLQLLTPFLEAADFPEQENAEGKSNDFNRCSTPSTPTWRTRPKSLNWPGSSISSRPISPGSLPGTSASLRCGISFRNASAKPSYFCGKPTAPSTISEKRSALWMDFIYPRSSKKYRSFPREISPATSPS